MKCSQCQHSETKVIESRDSVESSAVRRRRECLSCRHRFTTYERVENPQLVVVKNDGTRQMFSREKLTAGLLRACEKTSVTAMQIEGVVSAVEKELYSCGEAEIESHRIGEVVMDELAAIDEVAYVRFASVYKRFKDVASFEQELSKIKNKVRNN